MEKTLPEQLYNQLQFEKCRQLLANMPVSSWQQQLKTRCDCALQDFEALQQDLQVLDPKNPAWIQAAYILGRKDLMEKKTWQSAPGADSLKGRYLYTLYLMDEGKMHEARQQLTFLKANTGQIEKTDLRFLIDLYMSLGDFHTFAENELLSQKEYEQAIAWADQLEPESFRLVRTAFLWNNLADLYEQMEQTDLAEQAYEKAQALLKEAAPFQVDDYGGYQAALNLAYGNFLVNEGRYDQGFNLFEQTQHLLDENPQTFVNPQAVQAKVWFFTGLSLAYLGQDVQAGQKLAMAASLQKELVRQKKEKPLELARTLYYLTGVQKDPDPADLQFCAKIFEQHLGKDPLFYIGALAEIWNTLALLDEQNRAFDYERALAWFEKGLETYPEDQELALSYAACLTNQIQAGIQVDSNRRRFDELVQKYGQGAFQKEFKALVSRQEN